MGSKLGTYNRVTVSLETFLGCFEGYAKYYAWTDNEKLFHLMSALDGTVENVLWVEGAQDSSTKFVSLLRSSFGNKCRKCKIINVRKASLYRLSIKILLVSWP